MAKKIARLNTDIAIKETRYIPGGLKSLLKEVSQRGVEDDLVRINFEVPKSLRNQFKSKTAKSGKTVKDVLICFMEDYIRKEQ